jgi:hypothetical protein
MISLESNCILLEHFLNCMKYHSPDNYMKYQSGTITSNCYNHLKHKFDLPIISDNTSYINIKINSSNKEIILQNQEYLEYREVLHHDKRNEETKCNDFKSLINVFKKNNIDTHVVINNISKKCYEKYKNDFQFYKFKFLDIDFYPYPTVYKKDGNIYVRDPTMINI